MDITFYNYERELKNYEQALELLRNNMCNGYKLTEAEWGLVYKYLFPNQKPHDGRAVLCSGTFEPILEEIKGDIKDAINEANFECEPMSDKQLTAYADAVCGVLRKRLY